jgi:GNAT superfamily N-acetyltransferase
VNGYTIAPARAEDLPRIPIIELAAAELLRGQAPEAVLQETSNPEELIGALRDGRLWVARANDVAVGYAHVHPLDASTAHLEEVDVLPEHGRRGLGTELVTRVCDWARAHGYDRVTLTTFRDVPWNMPFYQKLGFAVVPHGQLGSRLLQVVATEAARGLDARRRVVMSRRLRGSDSAGPVTETVRHVDSRVDAVP